MQQCKLHQYINLLLFERFCHAFAMAQLSNQLNVTKYIVDGRAGLRVNQLYNQTSIGSGLVHDIAGVLNSGRK